MQIDNPQPEIDDVVNYPNVRTFFTELVTAETPQEDVGPDSRSWAVPVPGKISIATSVKNLLFMMDSLLNRDNFVKSKQEVST